MSHQSHLPSPHRKTFSKKPTDERVQALLEWIDDQNFTHFITLAPNSPDLRAVDPRLVAGHRGIDRLKALARHWDAHMNRALLGPKWNDAGHREARMFALYIPEKVETNPHLHVLLRINDADPDRYARKLRLLEEKIGPTWMSLIRSGSTHMVEIYDEGAANYVVKTLGNEINYTNFILPGQFRTH